MTEHTGSEIAIIGMACRFPGAKNLDQFWRNLRDGVDSLTPLTDDELRSAGVDPAEFNDPNYVRAAYILDDEDVQFFDASFFGYTPREAEVMDPQQRLFMECAWQALEHAGYDPQTFDSPIGVFAGAKMDTYLLNLVTDRNILKSFDVFEIALGNDLSGLATRLSYKFNLRGPSYALHTACSTSLVAVHLARQSLLIDECRMAIAGGIAIDVPYKRGYLYQPGSILSPDGHCRPFDAKAQGTVFGNGVGLVVMKRLEDALADGDRIYAVIRGSATNNDGSRKASFTAPGVEGQTRVILEALADADVSAETLSYVEAHGTATALGDPIEVLALTDAFYASASTDKKGFCAIGSVKSNLGHLDVAAGISSLIKTLLALQHKQIPPSLHFEQPNPKIDFANSPFFVNTQLNEWQAGDTPRRAGVSSFGFGSTNAHIILEEAPEVEVSGPSRPWQLLPLSAKTAPGLQAAVANLAGHLRARPDLNLADVAYTLQVGRQPFTHRQVVVCQNIDEAANALKGGSPEWAFTGETEQHERRVAFLFPGQGAQYVNMGRELYEHERVFRSTLDECAGILRQHLGEDLRAVLYPPEGQEASATERLNQTGWAQPALFAVEYALAKVWQRWGIEPAAMLGHSIGEYVAACLAEVFSLEDALALVAERGRLMQSMAGGWMLAVPLSEAELKPLLGSALSIAAVNGPKMLVVSGPGEAIAELERALAERDVTGRRLHTSHAFHSAMMADAVEPFVARVRQVRLSPPKRRYLSNVTGNWVSEAEACSAEYWGQQIRATVQFGAGLEALLREKEWVLLEVGPGVTLSTLARQHPGRSEEQAIVAAMRHIQDGRPDEGVLLSALGRLWLSGVEVDWVGLHEHERRLRVPLPTYPFQRQRYWLAPTEQLIVGRPPVTADKLPDLADWFYVPTWKRSELDAAPQLDPAQRLGWLVFADECGLSAALAEQLTQAGQDVIAVQAGEAFNRVSDGVYIIDPHRREDYAALLSELKALNKIPQHIVHAWNVTPDGGSFRLEDAQARVFYSLLFLAQTLEQQGIATPIRLTIVSDDMQRVIGDETLRPEKAMVLGPCKVIPKEYPHLACRSIDVALPDRESGSWADLAAQLIGECLASSPDAAIAYRGGERWAQSVEATRLGDGAVGSSLVRQGGVYLITGGLGGLGLVIAEHLARTAQARLILTRRSAFPDRSEWAEWLATRAEEDATSRTIRALQSLEEVGAEVMIACADVTDRERMQAVIAQACDRFGTLHGVIHAAGVAGDSMIQFKTPELAQAVLSPKVQGALVLHSVLEDRALDFLALFSSLQTTLGDFGQVDYSAANAFLDAFAQWRTAECDRLTIAIDWDNWQQVGIAVNTQVPPEFKTWREEILQKGILPQEGVAIFDRVLRHPLPQVIISAQPLAARIERSRAFTRETILAELARSQPATIASLPRGEGLSLPANELERRIAAVWQRVLGIKTVNIRDNFFDLGGNSLTGLQLISELKRDLGIQIAPVTLFEAPSVSALVKRLSAEGQSQAIERRSAPSTTGKSEIAIIGMAGRFPGAKTIEAFWQNLRDGVESITFFSDEELIVAGVPQAQLRDPNYVKAKPVLDDVEAFDAGLFGYSPKEAQIMDPQHRLFLECAWEVLESAGYDPETYRGSIGVYGGASLNTYLINNLLSNPDLAQSVGLEQIIIGNDKDSLTTAISYKFNLKGPSVAVQSFCSTALVAVHLACQSLLNGECDMALAGGVTITVPQASGYAYRADSIGSPDGHCRAFDADAQGTIFGNGVGLVALKRLDEALADGDHVLAVIKGSAINNDGSLKVGYTAPSVEGQAEVISMALAKAGVNAETIGYVEAHGTGTALGDPIELTALTKAFREHTTRTGFCAIGSVKSNVGHLDRAAGVASLIKSVLALQHRLIPPSLHFEHPNPKIDFADSPFCVNTALTEWKANGAPRRAGVSSLGFGGTNAHLILEEAPAVEPSGESRPWQLLSFSAKTATALDRATENLAEHLKQHPDLNLADAAYTLHVGRRSLNHRRMVVCRDVSDAIATLEAMPPQRVLTRFQEPMARPVAFMFPGQGPQYPNMGRDLYASEPVFREQIDRCCELLRPHLGFDLRQVIYPDEDPLEEATQRLQEPGIAQPALFVVEYALAQLWMSWGVRPQAMIGHSLGEYAAACLADVFSLADALALVAVRARMMQELPGGDMLSIPRPEADVQTYLDSTLSLAAVNSPRQCVASGPAPDIEQLERRLAAEGVNCRRVNASHAFHSHMMEPLIEQYAARVAEVDRRAPKIPFISSATGDWVTPEQAQDPRYWATHLRRTVRFSDGIREVLSEPSRILLEVGPGRTLSALAHQHLARNHERMIVASFRQARDAQGDVASLLGALGQLWLAGFSVDWPALYAGQRRRRVLLPTYAFDRQRYWIEPGSSIPSARGPIIATGAKPNAADWFYIPSWKRTQRPAPFKPGASDAQRWLIFGDDDDLSAELAARLARENQDVVVVRAGEQWQVDGDGYRLDPRSPGDYDALLDELIARDRLPDRIIHLWDVASQLDEPSLVNFEAFQDRGLFSLVLLAQSLGKHNLTNRLHLWVVTDRIHQVSGEEACRPEAAMVLGPCRIISHEYSNIACHNLDLTFPVGAINHILAEAGADSPELTIAYRGGHRWVPTVEAVSPGEANGGEPRLREGGVYLIAGALEDQALAFAEHLAQSTRARLIVVDPDLPPKEDWTNWQSAQAAEDVASLQAHAIDKGIVHKLDIDLAAERSAIEQVEARLGDELAIEKPSADLERAVDELCAGYLYEYLAGAIDARKGATYRIDEIREALGVLPKFEKFYQYMLAVLVEEQIVRRQGDRIEFLKGAGEITNPARLQAELEKHHPESSAGFVGLAHCVKHYVQALSGAIDPIGVLYPNGSPDFLDGITASQARYSNTQLYQRLIAELLVRFESAASGRKLRVLEVGGGAGLLTWEVVDRLRGRKVEYHFTDVGKSFVLGAQKRAAREGIDFMKFSALDVARDAAAQGFDRYRLDVIVAQDVIHATPRIAETMESLKKLLAPGGVMLLIEPTRTQRWVTMIWGLAEGWWYFADEDIRKHSPLLEPGKWVDVLARQQFQHVAAYPRAEAARASADHSLIAVQQAASIDTDDYRAWLLEVRNRERQSVLDKIRRAQRLEEQGAQVWVAPAEPLPDIVAEADRRFGGIHGVIHAAAPIGDERFIRDVSLAEIETHLRTRARDLLALDQALCDRPLDFAVLISPAFTLRATPGGMADSAMSHFMDAFAGRGAARWTSVNWARWQDEAPAESAAAQSQQAFQHLLSLNAGPQIIVSPRYLESLIDAWNRATPDRSGGDVASGDAAALHPRPGLANPYVAPGDETEILIAGVWQEVLGVAQVGVHDNFLDLGGDSLMATQLASRLRSALGLDLPLRKFFEDPTIAGLARIVTTTQAEQEESERREILAMLEQLSEQEVEERIKQMKQVSA